MYPITIERLTHNTTHAGKDWVLYDCNVDAPVHLAATYGESYVRFLALFHVY